MRQDWGYHGRWRGGQSSELGKLVFRGRRESLDLRVEAIWLHCKMLEELGMEDRRVQWLVRERERERERM